MSARLVDVVGLARARYLFFTAAEIDAATASGMGLVGEVVPHDELDAADRLGAGADPQHRSGRARHGEARPQPAPPAGRRHDVPGRGGVGRDRRGHGRVRREAAGGSGRAHELGGRPCPPNEHERHEVRDRADRRRARRGGRRVSTSPNRSTTRRSIPSATRSTSTRCCSSTIRTSVTRSISRLRRDSATCRCSRCTRLLGGDHEALDHRGHRRQPARRRRLAHRRHLDRGTSRVRRAQRTPDPRLTAATRCGRSLFAAYDALSPTMQRVCDRLTVRHHLGSGYHERLVRVLGTEIRRPRASTVPRPLITRSCAPTRSPDDAPSSSPGASWTRSSGCTARRATCSSATCPPHREPQFLRAVALAAERPRGVGRSEHEPPCALRSLPGAPHHATMHRRGRAAVVRELVRASSGAVSSRTRYPGGMRNGPQGDRDDDARPRDGAPAR